MTYLIFWQSWNQAHYIDLHLNLNYWFDIVELNDVAWTTPFIKIILFSKQISTNKVLILCIFYASYIINNISLKCVISINLFPFLFFIFLVYENIVYPSVNTSYANKMSNISFNTQWHSTNIQNLKRQLPKMVTQGDSTMLFPIWNFLSIRTFLVITSNTLHLNKTWRQ